MKTTYVDWLPIAGPEGTFSVFRVLPCQVAAAMVRIAVYQKGLQASLKERRN
jgi:hypothetical protein